MIAGTFEDYAVTGDGELEDSDYKYGLFESDACSAV